MKLIITVNLPDLDARAFDVEPFEDVIATAIGGMGYTGNLQVGKAGNDVHFPVISSQPVQMLHDATLRARKLYLAQRDPDQEAEDMEYEDNEDDNG